MKMDSKSNNLISLDCPHRPQLKQRCEQRKVEDCVILTLYFTFQQCAPDFCVCEMHRLFPTRKTIFAGLHSQTPTTFGNFLKQYSSSQSTYRR